MQLHHRKHFEDNCVVRGAATSVSREVNYGSSAWTQKRIVDVESGKWDHKVNFIYSTAQKVLHRSSTVPTPYLK